MILRRWSCAVVVVGLAVLSALASAPPADPSAAKYTGELPDVMSKAAPGELIPVSIVLRDQLTGPALAAKAATSRDPETRRKAVLGALEEHAVRTQAGLRAVLQSAATAGRAQRVRPLWIGNVVGADLPVDLIRTVAARPEVDHVNWNPKRDVFLGPKSCLELPDVLAALAPAATSSTEATNECGVSLIQAPRVWNELGNRGEGALIAMIDTGVCYTHPDINHQVWVNPGEDINHNGVVMDNADKNGVDDDGNGFVDDLIGWNFDLGNNDPNDENGHGSHTAGTVAGDGTSGVATGVAPGAKVMIIRVGVSFADEVDVWNAMQYAANNHAGAISMSLGWPHGQNPDRHQWRVNSENTIAAGTAMVIAAGNEGQGAEPDNVRTPGDVPAVITIGAVDCSDVIAGFSSRGPVSWTGIAPWNDWPYPPGLVKPDVSGPGVDTESSNFCSGYTFMSGTSMATPHVAGAVALMLAANPGLDNATIKQILQDTSVDLGAPGKDNEYGQGRIDAFAAVNNVATSDGKVSITETTVSCAGTMHLGVNDKDLRGNGTVTINVKSLTEPAGETATLTEIGTSGVFRGTINTATGPAAADGVVQVAAGDTVTATYIDANDGAGHTNVPKTDTATVDCTPPQISNVRSTDVGLTQATIRWQTNESSDSVVDYGPSIPPGHTSSSPTLTNDHAVTLTGLPSCTIHFYRVSSADAAGNRAVNDASGQYYYFETLGDFGDGPQSCHAGKVVIDAPVYNCSQTLAFHVSDTDLNVNPNAPDTATVLITSTTEPGGEWVTATETGPNTNRFNGTIVIQAGAPAADGRIEVAHGDTVTATYFDVNDGVGHTALSWATAALDCRGPQVSNLQVHTITDARATVHFTTQEIGDTVVEWGTTPALGRTTSSASLTTSHDVLLNQFTTCADVYFRIRTTDQYGNLTIDDNHGAPFVFHTGLIPGLYFKDSFENGSTNWTLGGEWEIGPPQGKGGSGGGTPDPLAAFNNLNVLGHDLTGRGTYAGDYEPGTTQSARSKALAASTWTNTKLVFYRQLNAAAGDESSIWIYNPTGLSVFTSSSGVADPDFAYQSIDVHQLVDGKANVQIEFRQKANAATQQSGWNIDELIFKDGSKPDWDACRNCSGAPSFPGATSALDNNACAASGVTVSWDAAPSWGSGATGTYAVYRGTAPGFPADAAHLVASGVAGLSYNDASAPAGTLYYLVRAESNETCGAGPANHGVVDGNTNYVPVVESTSVPAPGAIGTLGVAMVAKTHDRLTWNAPANAARYAIYRSLTASSGFTQSATTAGLFWDDTGAAATHDNYFYAVRAVNACGVETP